MTHQWRVLPPAEWSRLVGTEAESVYQGLDPLNTQVLVVEHEGAIVGTWILLRVIHAECLWIREDHRKRFSVAAKLLRGMRAMASAMGARAVWTNAMSDDVRHLLTKVQAVPVPGEAFMLPIGDHACLP